METGFKGTEFNRTKKGFIEKDILETKGVPSSVKSQKITGKINVMNKELPFIDTDIGRIHLKNTSKFRASGKTYVSTEGKKPIEVLVDAKGITKSYPSLKYAESEGIIKFKYFSKKGFAKVEQVSFRPLESSNSELGRLGSKKTLISVEKTGSKLEPYVGESITDVYKIGKTDNVSLSYFRSKGKFSNIIEDVVGTHDIKGLSFGIKGSSKQTVDFGGKLAQELSTISSSKTVAPTIQNLVTKQSSKTVAPTIQNLVTKQASNIPIGIGKGITESIEKTIIKQSSGTKSAILDTSLSNVGKTTLVSGGKIISKTKDDNLGLISTSNISTKLDTKELQKTGSVSKTGLSTIMDQSSIQDTKELQLLDTGMLSGTKTDFSKFNDELGGTLNIQNLSTNQSQKQGEILLSKTKTQSLIDTDTMINISADFNIPNIIDPRVPIIIPPDDKEKGKSFVGSTKLKGKGYDVYVKERSMFHGKITKPTTFKKVNTTALTKDKALSLGATIADNTAAISFKIKPTKEKPTKSLISTKSFKSLEHKFTKKNNVYIEKNKHRLDTPGEQRNISLLGRQSKKKKGKGNVPYV